MSNTWVSLLLILYVGVVTVTILTLFSGWGYDDVFITYRYAENIAQGIGFVYNVGERVLSTTTPLFALLLAVLGSFGIEISRAAIFISVISLPLGAICLWSLGRIGKSPSSAYLGLLIYPFFPMLLSTIGSELPLFLLLSLSAIAFYCQDKFLLASVTASLAVLTRPEAMLVVIVLLGHKLIIARSPVPLKPILLFLAVLSPWLVYSTLNFGSPIPATLTAKLHQAELDITRDYLSGFSLSLEISYIHRWQYWVGAIFALLGIFIVSRNSRGLWLLLAWTFLHFTSLTLLGLPGYLWYYTPFVPAFLISIGYGVQSLIKLIQQRFHQGRAYLWGLGSLLAIAALISMAIHVYALSGQIDPRLRLYKNIGEWIITHTEPDASVGALEVGVIGYYAHRPMIDFAGIIQPDISEQLPKSQSYEDTALWGIKTYEPDYLVLSTVLYSTLSERVDQFTCEIRHLVEGDETGYQGEFAIYQCEW